MTHRDISTATNPDLRGSLAAMHRAAQMARQIARQTGTELVVVQDGRLVRIPAAQLGPDTP